MIAAQIATFLVFVKHQVGKGVDENKHVGPLPGNNGGCMFFFGRIFEGNHLQVAVFVLRQKNRDIDLHHLTVTAPEPAFEVTRFASFFQGVVQGSQFFWHRGPVEFNDVHANQLLNAVAKLGTCLFVGINQLPRHRVEPKQRR